MSALNDGGSGNWDPKPKSPKVTGPTRRRVSGKIHYIDYVYGKNMYNEVIDLANGL